MPDKDILIKNWFEKAKETLISAQKAIVIDELYMAQNRLYYAVFYAISALAQKNNFATSKHSQLKGWFSKEFVKSGKISIEEGKLYFELYENRQKADYTFTYKPKKENLEINLKLVEDFLDKIEKFL